MTDALAGENFLVWTGADFAVDERVAGVVGSGAFEEGGVGDRGAVEEGLACIPDLKVGGVAGEVCASGDCHGAEPLLVCFGAGVAGYSEGEHALAGSIALDLLEGVVEVLV